MTATQRLTAADKCIILLWWMVNTVCATYRHVHLAVGLSYYLPHVSNISLQLQRMQYDVASPTGGSRRFLLSVWLKHYIIYIEFGICQSVSVCVLSTDYHIHIPYSLKFLRIKIFEDFEDFCLALKILVLQRHASYQSLV